METLKGQMCLRTDKRGVTLEPLWNRLVWCLQVDSETVFLSYLTKNKFVKIVDENILRINSLPPIDL